MTMTAPVSSSNSAARLSRWPPHSGRRSPKLGGHKETSDWMTQDSISGSSGQFIIADLIQGHCSSAMRPADSGFARSVILARSLDSRQEREIPCRSLRASPCRLRPTESEPRSCRSLGPALCLQIAPPPTDRTRHRPSPPSGFAIALFQRTRPALRFDSVIDVPARISAD
jgi:hypothetical protein